MKRVIGISFALILMAAMILAMPAQSQQQQTGTVAGTVWDMDMKALEGVDCYILEHPDIIAQSDSGGIWIINDVPVGIHTLVLYKDGYERYEAQIAVTAGNTTAAGDLMLHKSGLTTETMALIGLIIVIIIVIAALMSRRVIISRKTVIDEVFFMYVDGRLIKHFTRRLKPDMDSDVLSSMLVAVQEFVKDSFRGEPGALDQMSFGKFQIIIARGQNIIIAALVEGDDLNTMKKKVRRAAEEVENSFAEPIKDWDGDIDDLADAAAFVKSKLIQK